MTLARSLGVALLSSVCCLGANKTLVLDDFESPNTLSRWQGPAEQTSNPVSHGSHALRIRMNQADPEISSTHLAGDWRGYDRLLFDLYQDETQVSTATLRIADSVGADFFEAGNKVLMVKGWTHVEVKLTPLRASSFLRNLALDKITRVTLSFRRGPGTVTVDNLRLAAGEEGASTRSRMEPRDAVSLIDNRWISARQVARADQVPEASDVTALRQQAEREADLLEKTIRAAHTQGIETIYEERHLVTADLGLRVRPLLAWFNNDVDKRAMFRYVAESCRAGRQAIEDRIQGSTRREEVDDTQMPEPLIPAMPHLKGRPSEGWFFRDDRGRPMMILSLHSPSEVLQRFFATPLQHIESYSVGGGSRWTIDQSPVYAAFHQDPDTHRVGWDGWCGHLVRDLDSMGGTKKENVVICLESPLIHQAIREYIRTNIPRFHKNPELLYNIMAYELMYICYCDRSRQMFHQWLEKKHGTIGVANELWGTRYASFDDVAPPPVKHSRPLPGTNRALWYDWARFNQDRFTDYLLWVRSEIRKVDSSVPLAAGGSSSMLAGRTGTTGIDEERIVNEVDDVIIHEGGGSTMGMDLQLALSNQKKPLADPEMSLGDVQYLLPHFLHGKSVAQLFHWPSQPANEYYSNDHSSLAHSWNYPLPDIGELLRVALDLRRLNKEIAAFVDAPAEVAILYSQTSTLQLPPEMLTWQVTPYLAELGKAYSASQFLDTKITFVTERQVLSGKLARFKLLLVPGVRNLPAPVVESIWSYVAAGGHALILPESMLGDEYNRPRDYLARLGVTIRGTERPEASGSRRMAQGYDQSFSQSVSFSGGSSLKLSPSGSAWPELETTGVRQAIDVRSPGAIVYRYPDGKPAVVAAKIGKGTTYYSAASLQNPTYARLLDRLMTESGVLRPIRALDVDGRAIWNVEVRCASAGNRRLMYVSNFNARPVRLRLEAPANEIQSVTELRESKTIRGNEIPVPARQTNIYALDEQ